MLCFDIGANVGNWSIANVSHYNKIISVEASPDTFEELIKNTKISGNIICLNYAVCNNNNEDVSFYSSSSHTLSSLNLDWFGDKSRFANTPYTKITCKSITIDALIHMYGMPDLIKIDVEGGEYSTISSLTKKISMLCFEWASEMNDITFMCLEHLSKLGFNKYFVQYKDDYSFRPSETDYTSLDNIKLELLNTIPKVHWGMIWAK
jgi:FkbM family methyltransferase